MSATGFDVAEKLFGESRFCDRAAFSDPSARRNGCWDFASAFFCFWNDGTNDGDNRAVTFKIRNDGSVSATVLIIVNDKTQYFDLHGVVKSPASSNEKSA